MRRRVAQGHREVVLTGINLGCFRDREAGYTLARLVREAGADSPGSSACGSRRSRSTTSTTSSSRALRETPTVSPPPARAAPVGRRRRAARDGPPLHGRDLPAPARAARRLQPDDRRDRRLPGRGRARVRANTLGVVERGGHHEGARLPVLAAARDGDRGRRPRAAAGEEGAQRPPARALRTRLPAPLAREGRDARTSCSSTARAAATATTTRRGSSSGAGRRARPRARATAVTEGGDRRLSC